MKSIQFVAMMVVVAIAFIGLANAQTPWNPETPCIELDITYGQSSPVYTLRPTLIGQSIVITQTHGGDTFDPDVFIRWNEIPTRYQYDYADLTKNPIAQVTVPVDEARRQDPESKLFIIVNSYSGSGRVKLCYKNYQCPNKDCGSAEGAGTCEIETRTCTCNQGFVGRYCQMKQQDGTFDTVKPITISPSNPVALKYTSTELTGEIHMRVERDVKDFSDVIVRARRGQVPSSSEFDFEERIDGSVDTTHLEINTHAYAPGDWYFTLETSSTNAAPFTISVVAYFYRCPNNCSGQGTCDIQTDGTGKCTCNNGYTLSDCSYYGTLLHIGSTLPVSIPASAKVGFHFDVTQHIEDVNVELLLRFNADTQCEPHCPTVYIQRSTSGQTRASKDRYIALSRHPVPQQQAISVPDANLEAGSYTVTIDNTHSAEVKGTAGINFVPHCPKNCSGHGSCSANGLCVCHEGFHSSDCSVTKETCSTHLPAASGLGGFGLFIAIVFALGLGAVGGVFFFKFSTKGSNSSTGSGSGQQQVLSSDDQYAQLT